MQLGMPLKTKATSDGLFTPQEVYNQLAQMFTCVYDNDLPEGRWELKPLMIGICVGSSIVSVLCSPSIFSFLFSRPLF